ncbi:uncharacterized protein LOC134767488 [Penaeus indicus]|uniref:uncharacterized protein LOC134767488 n=1 Tax=Penaeus indicus TaxID=29960 RepID=UPI00300D7F3A
MAQTVEVTNGKDETSPGMHTINWLAMNEFPSTWSKNSANITAYMPTFKTWACKAIMETIAPSYKYNDANGTCDVYGPNQVDSNRDGRIFHRLSLPSLGALEEISRGKPAEASLHERSYAPEYANDDSNTTMYHSANGIARTWWMLDLLQQWKVYAVEILPRNDYLPAVGRFHDIEVRVGTTSRNGEDFSAWTLHGQYVGPYTVAQGRLRFMKSGGSSGRYLVIQKVSSDTDQLQIVDVRVYAELIQ